MIIKLNSASVMYYKIVSRKSCDFYTMCIFFNLKKRTVYQLC